MCVCMYVLFYFILFKHAPLHLVILHAELILLYIKKCPSLCHFTLFRTFFQLCYSKSKSTDSIKVMNGFRNFVINYCLLIGHCPGWIIFFFRVPLFLSRSLQW